MKTLKLYLNKLDAELAAQYLRSQDIKTEVQGHKEYASHLIGSDMGRFELAVDERYFDEAKALLESAQATQPQEQIEISPQRYLKRSIVYAMLACFLLPLIFNFASLLNLNQYRRAERNSTKKMGFTLLVLAFQLPTIFPLYIYVSSILKWIGTFHSNS